MRNDNSLDRALYWLTADRMPATKLIIIINVLTFFMALMKFTKLLDPFMFTTVLIAVKPWSLLTYPLIGIMPPFSLLFAGYWLWWAGGSLERSWSTRKFLAFFFGISAISAASMLLATIITAVPISLAGLWLPLAAVTVAFAMLNPDQQILFMFFIPMKLKYLALIGVVAVFITFASGYGFFVGLLALLGCAFSHWYVTSGRHIGYRSQVRPRRDNVIRIHNRLGIGQRLNPFRWVKKRREEKKFKDFLDRSGFGE